MTEIKRKELIKLKSSLLSDLTESQAKRILKEYLFDRRKGAIAINNHFTKCRLSSYAHKFDLCILENKLVDKMYTVQSNMLFANELPPYQQKQRIKSYKNFKDNERFEDRLENEGISIFFLERSIIKRVINERLEEMDQAIIISNAYMGQKLSGIVPELKKYEDKIRALQKNKDKKYIASKKAIENLITAIIIEQENLLDD